jgi:ABC-2 type transport system ATP-binding protein
MKRRTATTSRRPSVVRSATSSRVVLVPMSTHAQRIRLPSSPAVTASAPAILVRDLHKAYGDNEAVRGIDFEVATGEVFGLLGPNGAGKTTTVEILEGYRSRTGGIVSVLGHDPQQRSRRLRERVGIVLQSTGMYRHITPREALTHFAGIYPRSRDVEEVIRITGLEEKADAYVRTLSGGQRRRLDLALALVGDPELIFLDEPTTGFDPAARRNAWAVIRSLQDLGKTILLTTHYLDEAQALCDRVAIIKDGRILVEGPPGELGAASTRYRVSWRDADGTLQTRELDDPTALLHQLTSAALARGEPLHDLSVTRPSLEDVYLELTAEPPAEAVHG